MEVLFDFHIQVSKVFKRRSYSFREVIFNYLLIDICNAFVAQNLGRYNIMVHLYFTIKSLEFLLTILLDSWGVKNKTHVQPY